MNAEQMASAFVEFGRSKSKPHKHTYALNVLDFIDARIDGLAFEGGDTSDSSNSIDLLSKSIAT